MDETIEDPLKTLPPIPFDFGTLNLDAFCDAVARGIYTAHEIAERFNMPHAVMIELVARRPINQLIRTKRALWNSEGNAGEKLTNLTQIGLIEALPDSLAMLHDTTVAVSNKVELLKTFARIAGVESRSKADGTVIQAARFAVNIHFSGGRQETIATTVVATPEPVTIEGVAA